MEREKLLQVMEALNRVRQLLLDLAAQSTDIIMPGYSFGQHAQPLTLAHMYLSWVSTLARDFDRHLGAYRRVNVSAAGAAIMVGSDFPIDRKRTAELLGFDSVHENSADAILELTPDDMIDVAMVFAQLYHSMARWADDLIQWSTSEYDFVNIPDRFCITSSIMMQKKNVVGPAEIKGASAEALSCIVTLYHSLKGTTGLAITERHYGLETLWRVGDNLARHLDWFCQLLPELKINKAHMLERSKQFWATATDLASALVRKHDMPWRTAHQIVGILIRFCEERGLGPADVTPELLDEASVAYHGVAAGLTLAEIHGALDPTRFVAVRTMQGSPAPSESQRQIGVLTASLSTDTETVASIKRHLAEAGRKLHAAADEIMRSGV
jgi:argininosuccinate lyase